MPATGEIYQVTYQIAVTGQLCENVIHFREMTSSSTPAQLRTSAEKYLTAIAPVTSNQALFPNMIIKQMTPIAFDETVGPPATTVGGSVSSVPVNNTVAQILTKRTGTAGKTHRGRIYLAGLANNMANANELNSTGVTAMVTARDLIMSTFGPSGTDTHLQIGVYSRSIGGSVPFTVAGWQPLTSIDIQPVFGNQRRRRLGVGI